MRLQGEAIILSQIDRQGDTLYLNHQDVPIILCQIDRQGDILYVNTNQNIVIISGARTLDDAAAIIDAEKNRRLYIREFCN